MAKAVRPDEFPIVGRLARALLILGVFNVSFAIMAHWTGHPDLLLLYLMAIPTLVGAILVGLGHMLAGGGRTVEELGFRRLRDWFVYSEWGGGFDWKPLVLTFAAILTFMFAASPERQISGSQTLAVATLIAAFAIAHFTRRWPADRA